MEENNRDIEMKKMEKIDTSDLFGALVFTIPFCIIGYVMLDTYLKNKARKQKKEVFKSNQLLPKRVIPHQNKIIF